MKKSFFHAIGVILACAILSCQLLACSERGELLDYQNEPFSARLRGKMNSIEFSAVLTLGAPADGARDFTLSLLSPESLAGLEFFRNADGGISARLGSLPTEFDMGEDTRSVGALVNAFTVDEVPKSISAENGKDVELSQYEKLTKLVFSSVVIYVDPESALPVKIQTVADGNGLCEFEIFIEDFSFTAD